MKTVRSFANEEEEAEVYSRKLQQVYKQIGDLLEYKQTGKG